MPATTSCLLLYVIGGVAAVCCYNNWVQRYSVVPPPGEDEASFQEGSEAGGYTSDFKRGKRLRKLAHMLNSRRAQAAHSRFYRHAVLVVLGLMAAHLACFATSVVMIDNQRLFITEVDGANTALNYMHRSAIKCL